MPIGLGQMTALYTLLQRKNPSSELLNEEFWTLRRKIEDPLRRKLWALMSNGQVIAAENILKELK